MKKTSVKYPASIIQEQFWLINQIQPDNSAYNIPSLFRLSGHLNRSALKHGIDTVLLRHEVLRSTFLSENGKLWQVVHEAGDLATDFGSGVDWVPDFDEQERERRIRSMIQADIRQPFNLAAGPLFRVKLYRNSEVDWFLLVVMHHIITDLHSKDIFSAELSSHYNAYVKKERPCLEKRITQYADYSAWQQEFLHGEQYRASLSFWAEKMKDTKSYLNLPLERQRPATQELRGAAVPFRFSAEFTQKLKRYSRQNKVTIFLVTLSAYLILLYRYSGQEEITIGIPFSNRRQKEHKDTFGCFVNVLPLSFSLSPSKNTFGDVLQQVRAGMLTAHRNQEVPYELLVKEVQPERDPSYNSLFQVGFTYEPPMELRLQGLDVKSEKIHNSGAQLDLFANLWEQDEELHGMFEYNTDLFEKETVQRFTGHFHRLLESVLLDAKVVIDQLSILPAKEQDLLVAQWNATEVPFLDNICLQHLFEKQARKRPDSIACSFVDEQLSYKELDERASKLAHYLQRNGVVPGGLVGIFLERSIEMLVALLAVLKAGAAYVPLDPDFPRERIGYMVEDSNVAVLLTKQNLAGQLPAHTGKEIYIDTEWPEIEKYPADHLDPKTTADDLAYVIYTSGSTGRPKGVQVHHQAVVNFLTSMADAPGLTEEDTLLAVTTLSFDISVLELFLPLSVGGRVVIAPQRSIADGQQLKKLIAELHITVMQATPTTWHLLIAGGWKRTENFKALCGGEPMPADLAGELLQRASSVWNLYGPTETTVWSTCHRVSEDDSTVLVGRPIANTQTYIVDKYGQPTPIGVAGELLIGGAGVTKGYLARPNLTAEKFTPDTFSSILGQKLYHTGDMATYLPDGRIKLHGRVDQQIKLRGYRIELGEIEAALLACPGVGQAAILVKEVGVGDQRLVAYFTSGENGIPSVNHRTILQSKLPRYMLPSFFVHLEHMPLTANGKIDRAALALPEQVLAEGVRAPAQAGSKTETLLCSIWNDVLKAGTVGVHDNFFDLGGNSLLCLQVLTAIEKKMAVKIPTVKFFQYPTVSSFANYLLEGNDGKKEVAVANQAALRRKALLVQQRRSLQGESLRR